MHFSKEQDHQKNTDRHMNVVHNYDKAPLGQGGLLNRNRKDLSEGSVLKVRVNDLSLPPSGPAALSNQRYNMNMKNSKDFDYQYQQQPPGPQPVQLNSKAANYGFTDPKLLPKRDPVANLWRYEHTGES